MKKFKEYFENRIQLKTILTKQEIEDQFLRLEEVLGTLNIVYYHNTLHPNMKNEGTYEIQVTFPYIFSKDGRTLNIIKELYQIQHRMEDMFPIKFLGLDKCEETKNNTSTFYILII